MTMNPLATYLAAEQRRSQIADADAFRRAKEARPASRHPRANLLTIRVRPIKADDAMLLGDMFDRLSMESRLARFLHAKTKLTAAELSYFTDVDHQDHEALVAVDRLRGSIVGVARFIRDREDPTSAEISFTVVDDWQNRGLGSLLATRLSTRAVCDGITHFTALIAAGTVRARRLLSKLGEVDLIERDGATVSYRVALPAGRAPARQRALTLAPTTGCA